MLAVYLARFLNLSTKANLFILLRDANTKQDTLAPPYAYIRVN